MALGTSPTVVMNKIATSLVAQERYQTVEEALWEMALSTLQKKCRIINVAFENLKRNTG